MQVNLSYGSMKLTTFIFQLLEETPNVYIFSCLRISFILVFFRQIFVKQKFGMSWNYMITTQVFEFR